MTRSVLFALFFGAEKAQRLREVIKEPPVTQQLSTEATPGWCDFNIGILLPAKSQSSLFKGDQVTVSNFGIQLENPLSLATTTMQSGILQPYFQSRSNLSLSFSSVSSLRAGRSLFFYQLVLLRSRCSGNICQIESSVFQKFGRVSKHQRLLRAGWKCRIWGPNPDLLSQHLHLTRSPGIAV